MTQIDLLTGEPVPAPHDPNALTDRQQLALAYIAGNQPVTSDELGAVLHADRRVRGGRGHSTDERCDWCQSEGNAMGSALRDRGKVVRKKTVGWCLPDYRPGAAADDDGYDPATSEIPF